jgi:hypothetical protein
VVFSGCVGEAAEGRGLTPTTIIRMYSMTKALVSVRGRDKSDCHFKQQLVNTIGNLVHRS